MCLLNATEELHMCVCHNMLHNSTHTIFLLHQMNQFLQDFIQHPEEAQRRGKNIITIAAAAAAICAATLPTCP